MDLVKCLIWDLDDTLWEGTLADQTEIRLKSNIPAILEELAQRGIVSSIASRNDAEMAISKLQELGVAHYFVFPRFSWGPKPPMIRKICKEMNILYEHVAFIDDSPFERAEVAAFFPDTLVLPAVAYSDIVHMETFIPKRLSAFTSNRLSVYRQLEQRSQAQSEWKGTRLEFLKSCEMCIVVARTSSADAERISELSYRANQFNASLRRYDVPHILDFINGSADVYVVRLSDIYADYGMVGFLVARRQEGAQMQIESFTLSCRVEGRGVGAAVISAFLKKWMNEGEAVHMHVSEEGDRNRQVRVLLHSLGFEKERDGALRFSFTPGKALPQSPEWLHITFEGG